VARSVKYLNFLNIVIRENPAVYPVNILGVTVNYISISVKAIVTRSAAIFGNQYCSNVASTSCDHALMPPAILINLANPCSARNSATFRLRIPERHKTAVGRVLSSSLIRLGTSLIGIKMALSIDDTSNSHGSRTSSTCQRASSSHRRTNSVGVMSSITQIIPFQLVDKPTSIDASARRVVSS